MTRAELKQLVSDVIIQSGDPIEVASCVLDTIDAFCNELEAEAREIDRILSTGRTDQILAGGRLTQRASDG